MTLQMTRLSGIRQNANLVLFLHDGRDVINRRMLQPFMLFIISLRCNSLCASISRMA